MPAKQPLPTNAERDWLGFAPVRAIAISLPPIGRNEMDPAVYLGSVPQLP